MRESAAQNHVLAQNQVSRLFPGNYKKKRKEDQGVYGTTGRFGDRSDPSIRIMNQESRAALAGVFGVARQEKGRWFDNLR
jgi:hypothetical protein